MVKTNDHAVVSSDKRGGRMPQRQVSITLHQTLLYFMSVNKEEDEDYDDVGRMR